MSCADKSSSLALGGCCDPLLRTANVTRFIAVALISPVRLSTKLVVEMIWRCDAEAGTGPNAHSFPVTLAIGQWRRQRSQRAAFGPVTDDQSTPTNLDRAQQHSASRTRQFCRQAVDIRMEQAGGEGGRALKQQFWIDRGCIPTEGARRMMRCRGAIGISLIRQTCRHRLRGHKPRGGRRHTARAKDCRRADGRSAHRHDRIVRSGATGKTRCL